MEEVVAEEGPGEQGDNRPLTVISISVIVLVAVQIDPCGVPACEVFTLEN